MNHAPRLGAGRPHRARRLGVALLLGGALGLGLGSGVARPLFTSNFETPRAEARGGSTLNWYRLDPGCEREPYGIIANYHEPGVRRRVRKQLFALRMAGQDRISVSLYHQRPEIPSADGRVTGTVLDSSDGRLHPQMEQNLLDYLADIRRAAFVELVFRYHPLGPNDVRNEEGWNDSLRDENWSLIASIEPLLRASGMRYSTDLFAEGMPRARNVSSVIFDNVPQFEDWSDYARFVWRAYADTFGTDNTLGFSFVSDTNATRIDARARHMDYIYGSRRPARLGFSLYGSPDRDEAWIFREYRRQLEDEGWGSLDWVIAETWYHDATAAKAIQAAIGETGKRVDFLVQWPVQRDSDCNPDVTEATPLRFDAFIERGF